MGWLNLIVFHSSCRNRKRQGKDRPGSHQRWRNLYKSLSLFFFFEVCQRLRWWRANRDADTQTVQSVIRGNVVNCMKTESRGHLAACTDFFILMRDGVYSSSRLRHCWKDISLIPRAGGCRQEGRGEQEENKRKRRMPLVFLLERVNLETTRWGAELQGVELQGVELHAHVFILYCVLIRMEKEKKKKQQLWHPRCSAHLRGPGEPARKKTPDDYLGAQRGLPSLLHELPQLDTSYSPPKSPFLPLLALCPVVALSFFASSDSHGTYHIFLHVLLSSRAIFPCTPPTHWFPGTAPAWCLTPTLAIHSFADSQV